MAKPRWLTLLVTLGLFVTTVSIVGHFAADAICVVQDAGGYKCMDDGAVDGRSAPTPQVTADLHGNFNLPPDLPALVLAALAFILAPITLTYLPYSPPPSSPPPKPLS
ncbi:MAG: hypothetical protein ACE5E7_15650 [Anaerolineae bacterium]